MAFANDIAWIVPTRIIVNREQRQRQADMDIGDLIPSVRVRGIMNPIIVDDDMTLLAGERRLMTALHLELEVVPCRLASSLTPLERQIIELEENVKRKDLTWQDTAKAVRKIHLLYVEQDPEWTVEATANILGMSDKHIWKLSDLGDAIAEGDQSIIKADSIASATTILSRRRSRTADEALNRILEIEKAPSSGSAAQGRRPAELGVRPVGDSPSADDDSDTADLPIPDAEPEPPFTVVCADAIEFMRSYRGAKFNLLLCDLPYGVALNGQANQEAFEGGGYESSPDIYWALCAAICEHWDNFMYPSSHCLFWFSMKFYTETIAFFEKNGPADLRINPVPLIWHKTDQRGIIPDAMRGPRQIYEPALLMSTGDRKIVRPVSNVYGAPTAKADSIHTNEKPEPMLRHFLSMLVDDHTRAFDPTCGSGSHIRTVESLGGEAALGLEHNPEFAERAQQKLTSARKQAKLSSLVSSLLAEKALDIEGED